MDKRDELVYNGLHAVIFLLISKRSSNFIVILTLVGGVEYRF